MTFYSRDVGFSPSAKCGVAHLSLIAALGFACSAGVRPAAAQSASAAPAIQGETLRRVDAMIASNLALSPENEPATTFRNVVSLGDADVVARAQALSDQAGHAGLHYDYFRFKALFDKARTIKADKVDIPAGTYHIYPPQTLSAGAGLVEASLLSHVVIDGHGATLSFASIGTAAVPLDKTYPRSGIHLGKSDHVTLRNLVLDWYEPLVVPVHVNGTGQPGSPQTLTVDAAFRIDPALPIPIRGILPYNVSQRRFLWSRDLDRDDFAAWQGEHARSGSMPYLCAPAVSGIPASSCFRFTGNQTYAFGVNEHFSPAPPHGDNFLGSVRDNNFGAIIADGNSSYLTISGITIFSSPGLGLGMINAGRAIHVSHVRIVRKPDALLHPGEPKRFVSALADGINVISTAGSVVIEDSEVADEADDGLNIRAALLAADSVGPHSFRAKAGAVANFYRIGGLVNLYGNKGNTLVATGVPITAVQPPAPGTPNWTVTVAPTSPELRPGSAYQVRVMDFDNEGVIVRNTWFHDSTERGVVVHNDNVAIIGNRFDRTGESAVQMVYDNQSGQPEGAAATNLVVAGNRIHDVNVSWFDPAQRSVAAPAAIAVYFSARSGFSDNPAEAAGDVRARHLAITDNVITDVPGAGIIVSQADDVVVARNHLLRTGEHPFGLPAIDGRSLVIERTTHLVTSGNTSDAPMMMPGQ